MSRLTDYPVRDLTRLRNKPAVCCRYFKTYFLFKWSNSLTHVCVTFWGLGKGSMLSSRFSNIPSNWLAAMLPSSRDKYCLITDYCELWSWGAFDEASHWLKDWRRIGLAHRKYLYHLVWELISQFHPFLYFPIFFTIANIHVTFISHLYLKGVATVEQRRYMSDMNVM